MRKRYSDAPTMTFDFHFGAFSDQPRYGVYLVSGQLRSTIHICRKAAIDLAAAS